MTRKVLLTGYGTLTTPNGNYVLLRPYPFLNDLNQPITEATYYVAYVDKTRQWMEGDHSVFAKTDPHTHIVAGTYEVAMWMKPKEITVEVPDDFQKEAEPTYNIELEDLTDEEQFSFDEFAGHTN